MPARGSSQSQQRAGNGARPSAPARPASASWRPDWLHDAADTFFNMHARLPTEQFARAIDAGSLEPLVETPRRHVHQRPANQLRDALDRDLRTGADVDRFT